jgi:hypothetical protein
MNREQMIDVLKTLGVKVRGTSEDFDRSTGGIWIAADSNTSSFDYYSERWVDTFGVDPLLSKVLDKNGWHFEWYDAGTMMVWPS